MLLMELNNGYSRPYHPCNSQSFTDLFFSMYELFTILGVNYEVF